MKTYCLNFCMQIPKGLKSTKDISLERQLRGESNINQDAINSENNVTFLDKLKKKKDLILLENENMDRIITVNMSL